MSTSTNTIGENGKCGKQHAFERCLPQNGKRCCSINGYCGDTESYCLRAYGCQYDCEGDEPDSPDSTHDFPSNSTTSTQSISSLTASTTFLTATSTNTLLFTSPTSPLEASGTEIESPTSTATAAAAQKGLQGAAKTGVIVGAALGGVALLALLVLLFCCYRRRRWRNVGKISRDVTPPVEEVRPDPKGFYKGPTVQSNTRILDI